MIKLIAIKSRDGSKQVAFFMVDEYDFSDGSVPVELNTNAKVLTWLKKNKDRYIFLILQKLYRDGDTWADWQRYQKKDMTDLEAFQKWVKAGHRNLIGKENGKNIYRVIPKQPWQSTHPKGLALKAQLAEAKTPAEIKKILEKMIAII